MQRKNMKRSECDHGKIDDVSDIRREMNVDHSKEANDTDSDKWIGKLIAFDVEWSQRLAVCAAKQSTLGFLRPLMKLLEISCHGIPWLLGNMIAILVSHQVWIHEVLLNLFAALLLDLAVIVLVKLSVRRPRPAHNKMDMFATISVDKFSFPSGHTTRAATVACLLIFSLPLTQSYIIGITCWAVSVAISRVMLGRHHIFDVLCGLIIGVVQYYVLINYLWMPRETCESIIRPIQEELHL